MKLQDYVLASFPDERLVESFYWMGTRNFTSFGGVHGGIPISEFYREVIELITHKQFGKCSLAVIIFSDPRGAKHSYIYLKG